MSKKFLSSIADKFRETVMRRANNVAAHWNKAKVDSLEVYYKELLNQNKLSDKLVTAAVDQLIETFEEAMADNEQKE